jgi:phasin family protein
MATKTVNGGGSFDITKSLGDFNMIAVDTEALFASQRKNFEALTQCNMLAAEGAQAVLRRQFDMTRQLVDDFSALCRDVAQPNASPAERVVKHAEYAKKATEQGVSTARELAEIVTKANSEALDLVAKRMAEGLEELKAYAGKSAAAR